ncbi:MAG: SAM-dependent chlorinase/fluorinase [Chloroflexota bacterium]
MGAIITLTTDFGLTDAYIAAMKGVILGINPEAQLVDICHMIQPQNISQAAFVLSTAYRFFPAGTTHVVVVDPGVGSERRAVILKTPEAHFVAPDNGALSYIINDYSARQEKTEGSQPMKKLEPELAAVAITRPTFWRTPVSPTFHGRDIFAPVAARLSLGFPALDFGEPITSLTMLPLPSPYHEADGSLVGYVMHIDSFGNLLTNIRRDDLPSPKEDITAIVGGRLIHGLSRTYAAGSGLLALIGSSDYLEIAYKGGSARDFLQAKIGDEVRIRPRGENNELPRL